MALPNAQQACVSESKTGFIFNASALLSHTVPLPHHRGAHPLAAAGAEGRRPVMSALGKDRASLLHFHAPELRRDKD
eukprot:scaffold16082_cov110-Isochrysis_galbana.AAC.4